MFFWKEVDALREVACSFTTPTDKINGGAYDLMYGLFLSPWSYSGTPPTILEVGLGCDMTYGPGASARLWRKVLPEAKLWEAEIDGACIDLHREELRQLGIRPLVGNQSNRADVERWKAEVGQPLDVVIDDGSHRNSDILATFHMLWPSVSPGGLYFMEDLNVGRQARWDDTNKKGVIVDVLKSWIDQTVIFGGWATTNPKAKHPLPDKVAFVFCQRAACVIGKQPANRPPFHAYRSGPRCKQA